MVITVATTLMDELCRHKVSDAASAQGYRYVDFPAESDLLSAIGEGLPEILVMPLDDDFSRPLRLQARFRSVFDPLCVVYIAMSANMELAVRAMQLGAVTVLPGHCSSAEISKSLLTAANRCRVRAAWTNEIRYARKTLNLLTERQREVLSRVSTGQTNKAIGLQLRINTKTVEKHRAEIHRRTKTLNLPDLVRLIVIAERPNEAAFGLTSDESLVWQLDSPLAS